MKSIIRRAIFLFLSVLIFISCDNIIGLGSKVNTDKPIIKNAGDENKPGDFISGNENIIWLEVEQKFGIDSVFMEVEFLNKETGEKERKFINAYYDENRKQWYVNLDTGGMEDGSVKAWVTAIDIDGNRTTTTDIVYFVKNLPPQIKLNMPVVEEANFDDDNFLDSLKNNDPLYLGFELMGLATDNYGIEEGYPKIMIWPEDLPDVDADGIPLSSNGRFGTWRSLVVPNKRNGLTATKFSWPMLNLKEDPAAPGGYRLPEDNEPRTNLSPTVKYRFRIVTKDLFGNENYYPNRTDNKRGPEGQAMNPEDIPRKYIEISYTASDIPIIQVTEFPQYYNAAKDFDLSFLVSSANAMYSSDPSYIPVTAYITDGNDGNEKIIGGPYYPDSKGSLGTPYKFSLTITPAQAEQWANIPVSGLMYVRLKAKDSQGKNGPDTYQYFNYDVTPAKVTVDRPHSLTNKKAELVDGTGWGYTIFYPPVNEAPSWVTGQVTIAGRCDDGRGSGVKKVYFHIGKLGDDNVPDSGKKAIYDDPANWIDTKLDTPVPEPNWSGSIYAPSYTFDFNNFKNEYPNLVQSASDLGFSGLSTDDYATSGTGLSGEKYYLRFYLPFYLKVEDQANNVQIIHYTLSIDPEMDKPQISINYPAKDTILGGTVRLSGIASDNDHVFTVLIRIPNPKYGQPGENPYYLPNGVTAYYSANPLHPAPLKPDGINKDTDGWFEAKKTGGSGMNQNWYFNINEDGGLTPTLTDTQPVQIQAAALDSPWDNNSIPKQAGPVSKLDVIFSSKVPTIEQVKIQKVGDDPLDYFEGINTSGKFSISMKIGTVKSGSEGGFQTLQARFNQGAWKNLIQSGVQLPNTGGWNLSAYAITGTREETTLTITVDSTVNNDPVILNMGWGKTGTQILEVQVTDNSESHYQTNGTYTFGIDNFFPSAGIQTPRIARESAGGFYAEGTAKDSGDGSGSIQGLERVLVYFEKAKITYAADFESERTVSGAGIFLRPNGTAALPGDFETRGYVRDTALPNGQAGANGPNVDNFLNFPKLVVQSNGETSSNAAIIIDNRADGIDNKWVGLLNKTWAAKINTLLFSDGPLIVHYIIMDQAGNATHYRSDIYIENNRPCITGINLGTDISGSGLTEFLPNPITVYNDSRGGGIIQLTNPSFRVRNNLFDVKLTVESGNNERFATVSYVTPVSGVISASQMKRGRVYTIAAMNNTDFTLCGALNNQTGTTFVASDTGVGTGTVTQYSEEIIKKVSFGTGGSITASIPFNTFTSANPAYTITDSPKDSSGNIIAHNQKLFVVKVYDSAVSQSQDSNPHEAYDQLAHAVLVAVDIDNTDQKKPSITAAPFGEKYTVPTNETYADDSKKELKPVSAYTENIALSNTGERSGYVQYAADSSPAVASISGKVIFTGKAEDNQRIRDIYVTISGYNGGNRFPVAQWNAGTLVPMTPSGAQNGQWEFKIIEDHLTLEYGHALNWEFTWDSSKHDNIAQNNVNINFEVRDFGSADYYSDAVTVNIVPYISEVITPLSGAYASSPSAFNRSALGGYPVRELDQITVKGFNFGTANAAINGIALTGNTNTGGTTITGTVPNTAVSGPLVVTVNGITSINNRNNKTAVYNTEPNGVNNNILDNNRYVYVWRTGYLLNEKIITNPFFRMDPKTAARYLTFGYYGTQGEMRIQINSGDGRTWNDTRVRGLQLATIQNRYISTTVAVGPSGEFYAASSNQTQGGHPFALFAADRPFAGMTNGAAAPAVTRRRLIVPSDPGRITIPRIFAGLTNDPTPIPRILMSYYDNNTSNVILRYGTRNAANSAVINGAFADLPSDTNAAVSANGQTVSTGTYRGSNYTAVGALFNGRPVLAFYDGTNNNLVVAKGTAAVNNFNNNINWNYYIIPNPDGSSGAGNYKGSHVDLAVDDEDNVHLAFYDIANGGLYYLLIPATGSQTARDLDMNGLKPVRVDTYLAAGTKIMLNVRKEGVNNVPYITYFHGSFAETRNSIRAAWQKKFPYANGTDERDMFTGAWEVMTVPAQNVPIATEMICNGIPTAETLWQDTGLTRGGTDLTKSIVIGYMTDQYYEGAILKDNMTTGLQP